MWFSQQINFRGVTSRKLVIAKGEDLEVENEPIANTLAVVVLDLTENFWTEDYQELYQGMRLSLNLRDSRESEGFITLRITHIRVQIPFLIPTGIDIGAKIRSVWSIQNEDLQAALDATYFGITSPRPVK